MKKRDQIRVKLNRKIALITRTNFRTLYNTVSFCSDLIKAGLCKYYFLHQINGQMAETILKKNPTGNFAAMHPSKTYAFFKKVELFKTNKICWSHRTCF